MKTSLTAPLASRVSTRPFKIDQARVKPSFVALFFAILISAFGRVSAQSATSTSVTPALLMGFTGKVQNTTAQLDWTMEKQTNCKWFVIERSGDTGGFDSVGIVLGMNNNNINEYLFLDDHMMKGNNYYRLRQVDMDGVVRYSKVLILASVEATSKLAVYPNPAIAVLNYAINSPAAQQVIVQVYNLSGVILMTSEQQLSMGANQQTVAISGLKSGNYILRISNRAGSSQYLQPFVKIM